MVFGEEHDFVRFPELSNSEIDEFGFLSPHVQITSDFVGVVVKVHDGDTVRLRVDFRDFDFPLRLSSVDAPELSTGSAGLEARDFLKELIEGELVDVRIDRFNRVEKYGRLLGDGVVGGLNVGEVMVYLGFAVPFGLRRDGNLPDLNKDLAVGNWF